MPHKDREVARAYFKARYQRKRAQILQRHREYYQEHKDQMLAASKRWAEEHPEERRAIARAYMRRHYHKHRDKINAKKRERRTGMSPGLFAEYLAKQGGRCAICRQVPDRPFRADHCHTSGKVRGLLCSNCNLGLGNFKDDPTFLVSAIQYLESA